MGQVCLLPSRKTGIINYESNNEFSWYDFCVFTTKDIVVKQNEPDLKCINEALCANHNM